MTTGRQTEWVEKLKALRITHGRKSSMHPPIVEFQDIITSGDTFYRLFAGIRALYLLHH
jgi:hypothetical protein